jgi:hypothetical protein
VRKLTKSNTNFTGFSKGDFGSRVRFMKIKNLNENIKFLFFNTIFFALSVEMCSQTYFFSNEYVKGHFKLQKLNKDSLKVIGEIVNKKAEIIIVTPPEGYYGKVGSNAIDLFLGYDHKSTFNSPLEFKEIAQNDTIRFDYYLLGHISSRIKWITIRPPLKTPE